MQSAYPLVVFIFILRYYFLKFPNKVCQILHFLIKRSLNFLRVRFSRGEIFPPPVKSLCRINCQGNFILEFMQTFYFYINLFKKSLAIWCIRRVNSAGLAKRNEDNFVYSRIIQHISSLIYSKYFPPKSERCRS